MHILHCLLWIVWSCLSELKPLKFSFLTFRRSANTYLSQNGWEDQETWCLMYLVHCLGPSGFSVDAILLALPSHCPFSVALRGSCDCRLQVGIRDCRMAKPCVPNAASILAVWLPVWQTFFPGLRPDCIRPVALTEFSQSWTHMPGETYETASPLTPQTGKLCFSLLQGLQCDTWNIVDVKKG